MERNFETIRPEYFLKSGASIANKICYYGENHVRRFSMRPDARRLADKRQQTRGKEPNRERVGC